MTTYLGKSCSFCLPRVPFVNCRQFMYLVISLLVLRAGYGIWLYQFLIIAYLFTLRDFHQCWQILFYIIYPYQTCGTAKKTQNHVLSIHWLYRRSDNPVVKMLGVDISASATSHATSTFNMADVTYKKWYVNGNSYVKIKRWRSKRVQSPVMPNSDPRTDFSIRTSHMEDSYNLLRVP